MTLNFVETLDVNQKYVLVRVDFNVPIQEGEVLDQTRIEAHLPTIHWLRQHGAKVILMSHLGRPNGKKNKHLSLGPVARRLAFLLSAPVPLLPDAIGPEVENHIASMAPGDVCLLENLRFQRGEEDNDASFAQKLAALADVYVNDAFAVAHRKHASIVGVPKYQRLCAIGHLMQKELEAVKRILEPQERPVIFIIGGAKVSSKIKLVKNLVLRADMLMIGGAMANTFFASLGYNMGQSFYESDYLDTARRLMTESAAMGCRILLPVDVIIAKALQENAVTRTVRADEIPDGYQALDIGPATTELWARMLQKAKTILWNGPMGVIETKPFEAGTHRLIEAITTSSAYSIAGGGDTLLALSQSRFGNKIDYISTGGGALISALEGKPLPAIEALTGTNVL